jgi:ABC-type transporter Mla subunit MlaD
VNTTLEGVDQLVSELREVVRANREQLRAATYNLRLASESFKSLGQELRERPSRLLVSQPPEPRELP